jgi:hypothetical protein
MISSVYGTGIAEKLAINSFFALQNIKIGFLIVAWW